MLKEYKSMTQEEMYTLVSFLRFRKNKIADYPLL